MHLRGHRAGHAARAVLLRPETGRVGFLRQPFDDGDRVPDHGIAVPQDRHLAGGRREFVALAALVPIRIEHRDGDLLERKARLLHRQPAPQGPRGIGLVADDELEHCLSRQTIASIAALRNRSIPNPVSLEVAIISGWAAGCLGIGARLFLHRGKLAGLDLVDLGEDEVVADGGGIEHLHELAIDLLQPVPAVDQQQHPLQRLAAAKIIVDQVAPLLGEVLRRLGEAVARHVDEPEAERLADVEEIQFLRPARRVRRAGEIASVGERVQQRRLADIGPAGERHFGAAGSGRNRRLGADFRNAILPENSFLERSSGSGDAASSLISLRAPSASRESGCRAISAGRW